MKYNILHLERKFTSPTETFIVNQINTINNCNQYVFTVNNLNNLKSNSRIYSPDLKPTFFSTKFLLKNFINYFNEHLASIKPQLIHSHFLTDARYFHPLTKQMRIPKICSCYGYDVSKFPNQYGFLSKLYLQKTFKEYDFFLAMSEDMKNDLIKIGCPEGKIKIHYHGINTSLFQVERNYEIVNTFNILTIGSLVPKKGHMSVLKAINKIISESTLTNIKYMIVGKGPLLDSLKEYVNQNNLQSYVDFIGPVKHGQEFLKILQNAHVFVHPSITTKEGDKEGIPGTVVEAMASGMPVLSTYHAGIPYAIKNKEHGLLVKENDVDEIAGNLLTLYSDSTLRKKLGENARDRAVNDLDVYQKSKELFNLYASLIHC